MSKPAAQSRPSSSGATPRQLFSLLLVGGALLYARSLPYNFVYDDLIQIVSNPRITSWRYVPSYFTAQLWAGVQSTSYYRPLLLLWMRINHALFDFNPVGWHAALIALHLAATALAFLLARKLLRDARAALVTAAIFLLHPVQIESVVWPSAANEPLAAIFIIASYLFFLKSRDEESANRNLLLSWLMFALALMTKETAIVAPLMIFLFAWSYPRKSEDAPRWAAALAAEVPYAIVVGIYLLVRKLILSHTAPTTVRTGPATSLLTMPSVACHYLASFVVPVRLALSYDLSPVTAASSPRFWFPLLVLLVLAAASFWLWKRTRSLLLATRLLWIPIHLSVALLTVPLFRNSDFAHDRYLYVPLFGFALLVAYAWERIPSARLRQLALTFLLVFYGVATFHQEGFWRDNAALYARAYQVSPGSYLAKLLRGQQLADDKKYAQALSLLESAVASQPENDAGLVLLADTKCAMNDVSAAQSLFATVLRREPDSADAHFLLGRCQLAHGDVAASIPPLEQAVKLLDSNLEYRLTLGRALVESGRKQEALEQYRAAERLAPQSEQEPLRRYIKLLEQKH
jgi:tetratricopeptide (TPR) repeat protein